VPNKIEIRCPPGWTVYFQYSSDGQLYNGTAFEAALAAHWGTYANAAAEQDVAGGGTGLYIATFPALSPGPYGVSAFRQAGGAPATTDPSIGGSDVGWDGTNLTYLGGPVASVAAPVSLDLNQAVPTINAAHCVGDALNAARAQGFGKWTLSGGTMTIYAADGVTPVKTFTLNPSTNPTSRS
jgi:hypothetical protein